MVGRWEYILLLPMGLLGMSLMMSLRMLLLLPLGLLSLGRLRELAMLPMGLLRSLGLLSLRMPLGMLLLRPLGLLSLGRLRELALLHLCRGESEEVVRGDAHEGRLLHQISCGV